VDWKARTVPVSGRIAGITGSAARAWLQIAAQFVKNRVEHDQQTPLLVERLTANYKNPIHVEFDGLRPKPADRLRPSRLRDLVLLTGGRLGQCSQVLAQLGHANFVRRSKITRGTTTAH